MIEIIVEPKDVYVPLYYQPIYKVSQILMILEYNTIKGKTASISFLHTIAWGMRDENNLKILLDYQKGKRKTLVSWCYEPIMEKALTIALVNGYCDRLENGKIKLTLRGLEIISLIELNGYFLYQRSILQKIGRISLKTAQKWDIK